MEPPDVGLESGPLPVIIANLFEVEKFHIFCSLTRSCTVNVMQALCIIKPLLTKVGALCNDCVPFVSSSVSCEICEVIHYVAAPGGRQGLIV